MCVELELVLDKTDTFYELLMMVVVSVFRSLYLSFALKYFTNMRVFYCLTNFSSSLAIVGKTCQIEFFITCVGLLRATGDIFLIFSTAW